MTLRFIDGWDHYATADITRKWTSILGSPTVQAAGRFGGNCLRISTASINVTKTLPAAAGWVIGFAVKLPVLAANPLVSLLDAGSAQVELRLAADGTLAVTRAATALTGGASALALSTATWYYIEWKVTIADSIAANSCQVRVNGAQWINVTAGQDTKNTANATANQVRLASPASANTDFDDLYVCDSAGSLNNDFVGDCRVEALFPTGAGTTTQWTPSAGANWQCVDENPPTDDTDYVESSTAGQKDTYAMGDLASVPTAIFGVQTCLLARKTDAGSRSVAAVIRSGGADYDGATVALADTYAYLLEVREQDPDGPASWTAAKVSAMEAGLKLVN